MLVNIIYASTSGNVEAVCEKISEILQDEKFEVFLHRVEKTSVEVLMNSEFTILATSTWEHGEINPFFKTFLEEMENKNLSGKRASFVGLGDRRYEPLLFAEGMELLKRKFISLGGEEIFKPLKIDGDPYGLLNTTVVEWAESLTKILNNK